MVVSGSTRLSHSQVRSDPRLRMLKTTAFLTGSLTIAGISWYIAVGMTTPSDLTAIYNCNAFFAYAFSIPLLHEKPRMDKIISVGIAIIGVLIVAYGDGNSPSDGHEHEAANRVAGNVIIGVGSVLYGFYEVLYKRLACPPEGTSSGRSVIFANTIASGIGVLTLVTWPNFSSNHICIYKTSKSLLDCMEKVLPLDPYPYTTHHRNREVRATLPKGGMGPIHIRTLQRRYVSHTIPRYTLY